MISIIMKEQDKAMNLEENGSFWVLGPGGKKILRNLKKENDGGFTVMKYYDRDGYDDFNYMFFENYEFVGDSEDYGCTGSDYERKGCTISPGDVVVDIGANVGMFTRWAHLRGASRIISFEPVSTTFSCLVDNVSKIAECHKIAIGSKEEMIQIGIPSKEEEIGGGTRFMSDEINYARKENCISLTLGKLFEIGLLPEKIDFLKIDCEGSEKEIIETISDRDLLRIDKISMEYHNGDIGPETRVRFVERMQGLGYNHFTLFHGTSGDLQQVHFWKNK